MWSKFCVLKNSCACDSWGKKFAKKSGRRMCAKFPREFLNGRSVEKLITAAVRKPDNRIACLWTRFQPERAEIDWSGFKVGGDLTVQSKAHRPCKCGVVTRSDPYAPRDVNVIYHSWPIQQLSGSGEDYRPFSSSVRHSPIKVRPPPNLDPVSDLSCLWCMCRKISTRIS